MKAMANRSRVPVWFDSSRQPKEPDKKDEKKKYIVQKGNIYGIRLESIKIHPIHVSTAKSNGVDFEAFGLKVSPNKKMAAKVTGKKSGWHNPLTAEVISPWVLDYEGCSSGCTKC
jgi:hypothetical protein